MTMYKPCKEAMSVVWGLSVSFSIEETSVAFDKMFLSEIAVSGDKRHKRDRITPSFSEQKWMG